VGAPRPRRVAGGVAGDIGGAEAKQRLSRTRSQRRKGGIVAGGGAGHALAATA
jgi:hypothetical protein